MQIEGLQQTEAKLCTYSGEQLPMKGKLLVKSATKDSPTPYLMHLENMNYHP